MTRLTRSNATRSFPHTPSPSGTHPQPAEEPLRTISARDFSKFQTLIYRDTGIWLSEAKMGLLTSRLSKRLRSLGIVRYSQYFDRVVVSLQERQVLFDLITTNETQFFREPMHFKFLEEQLFPLWRDEAVAGTRPRTIRAWSAGCSTGQEAYSLAMTLLAAFPPSSDWILEVLATDLSQRALSIAEEGVWDAKKSVEIPRPYLRNYILKGVAENAGKIKAGPAIRFVRFLPLNLHSQRFPRIGTFDLIFCRNVMIYFDSESRRRVLARLLGHLADKGFLFVGHAETLNSVSPNLRCVMPTLYTHSENRMSLAHANGR